MDVEELSLVELINEVTMYRKQRDVTRGAPGSDSESASDDGGESSMVGPETSTTNDTTYVKTSIATRVFSRSVEGRISGLSLPCDIQPTR